MTHRVGPKGQVVIPKHMRDAIGIEAGDDVVFQQVDDGVVVRRAVPLEHLRGICRGGPGLLGDWDHFKRDEREAESRREAALGIVPPGRADDRVG